MPIDFHPQGSAEWHEQRLGYVTASRFADVMTNPRSAADKPPRLSHSHRLADKTDKIAGKMSKTARSYMLDLLAERLTRVPQGPRENEAMRWGNEHEAAAVEVYEALTGLSCKKVGFRALPLEKWIGGSADRLVGRPGGLEIKCPFNTRVHLEYWLAGALPKDHVAQVQGLMWITGRGWWDFCSFDPRIADTRLAFFRVRVERDDDYISELSTRVLAFRDALDAAQKRLTEGMNV
jgi:predicted phage-related endonuclease